MHHAHASIWHSEYTQCGTKVKLSFPHWPKPAHKGGFVIQYAEGAQLIALEC